MPKKSVLRELRIASNFAVQDGAPLKEVVYEKQGDTPKTAKRKRKKGIKPTKRAWVKKGEQPINHYRRLKKALRGNRKNLDAVIENYRNQNIPKDALAQ